MDQTKHTADGALVTGEDVARWLTFSGFWGFVFYVLSTVGMLIGQRKQPVRIHGKTVLVGMIVHVVSFTALGSLLSAVVSFRSGKSTTRMARERIPTVEQRIGPQTLGGMVAGAVPFLMSAGSLQVARKMTGKMAFPDAQTIDWVRGGSIMALLTAVTALAVSNIAAWVARDSRVATIAESSSKPNELL
ncbi:MAG: hypothetical protein HC837_13070 [Chloroflexaceae bacterium]|nr:hypothetical protein [Chloroflexaceae bacterium]